MSAVTIQTSAYTQDATPQADGSYYVVERHTDTLGRVLQFGPYSLSPGMDPNAIMVARAQRLNADFANQYANEVQAAQGRTPWTHLDFRDQLGSTTEQAMDAFFAGFETNSGLTPAQKDLVRTGWRRFQEASFIDRPLRTEVLSLLGLLLSLGLITQAQIDAINAASAA